MTRSTTPAAPLDGASPHLGTVLVAWLDMAADEEAGFNEWYNREHMRDRVLGLPGFRLGRRFRATRRGPKYMALYEAHDSSVFASQAYLSMVRNPDPNSRHYMSRFENPIRTIGRITVRLTEAEGPQLVVFRFAAEPGREAALRNSLAGEVLPRILAEPGIVAASLIEKDEAALAASRRQHLRSGDGEIDWAVLVEASDQKPLEAACARHLDMDRLRRSGASEPIQDPAFFTQLYRVAPRPD